jgi:hypothetical protein
MGWSATVAAALALVLAGCGGGSSSHSSASTSSSAAASSGASVTVPAPSSSSSSGGGGDSLSALSSEVQAASKASFKAVYTADNNGQTTTITLEQDPPKSLFESGSSEVIDTGTTSYYCTTSGATQCITAQGGVNPMAAMMGFFSPATIDGELQAFETEAAAHIAGVSVTFSNRTVAGLSSKCVTGSAQGHSGTYCVAKNGILTAIDSASSSFTLSSYSSSVSASDFSLPAGATTVTY